MGKKKIDATKRIEKNSKRQVTYCKRKRGILKKAIELSSLCDQEIIMVIYDRERSRIVNY